MTRKAHVKLSLLERTGLADHAFVNMLERLKDKGYFVLSDYPTATKVDPGPILKELEARGHTNLEKTGETLDEDIVFDPSQILESDVLKVVAQKKQAERVALYDSKLMER